MYEIQAHNFWISIQITFKKIDKKKQSMMTKMDALKEKFTH